MPGTGDPYKQEPRRKSLYCIALRPDGACKYRENLESKRCTSPERFH
jgi:hypothetical protein